MARNLAGFFNIISRLTIITMSRLGNRCWLLRKLSRNNRFSALRFTAVGTCFRAIANPSRAQLPSFLPIRIVIEVSLIRKLFLKTSRNSVARVNLSRLGKDSQTPASTLWRETRSSFCPTCANNTAPTASLHARTKPVRSSTL